MSIILDNGEHRPWPRTKKAWYRLKLSFAEWLVLSIPLRNHDHNYDLIQAADRIRYLRERYYLP